MSSEHAIEVPLAEIQEGDRRGLDRVLRYRKLHRRWIALKQNLARAIVTLLAAVETSAAVRALPQ